MAVVKAGSGSTGWYEFSPVDAATSKVFFYADANGTNVFPIDTTAFKKMVEAPGFAKLQQLLDPSVPASAAAVRQRYAIEAKANTEAAKVLPAGFRLKLDPGVPGGLELVGPHGVDTFTWSTITGSLGQISCPVGSVCFTGDGNHGSARMRPDGKARLGIYEGWIGRSTDSSVVLQVYGTPQPGEHAVPARVGKPVETAPQGPGPTPQQAMAIIQAPGVAKVIADVQQLTALD